MITSDSPPGGLRLRHAPQAVALEAHELLDGSRAETRVHLRFDEFGVGELLVTDPIVGKRSRGAGSFADEHEQLDRHAGPLGHFRKGAAAQRREPLEGGRVEEVERDLSASDGGAQPFQRNARCRQAPSHARAADMTRGEPALGVRIEDPKLHEPAQLIGADAAPLGRLGQVVGLHAPYCSGGAPDDGRFANIVFDQTGHENHGKRGKAGANILQKFDAAHAHHPHVADDRVELPGANRIQCFVAVGSHSRRETCASQGVRYELKIQWIVVHHENVGCLYRRVHHISCLSIRRSGRYPS